MRISDWSSDVCSCDLLSRTVPTASRCPFARMGWCNAPKCAIAPAMTDPRDILNSVFGFSDFRGVQRQVIARVLDGTRTLAVMPTGAGKSLCYQLRSEEHTSELQSLMRISYAVFCLNKNKQTNKA